MTNTIEEHIDVAVPVTTAYNQWTQFETFPEFMSGVESVTQTDDKHLHWEISIGGVKRSFDAEITEQHPDQRVAWKTTGGTGHAGVVTFHKLDDSSTRVMLQIDTEPEGVLEKIGDALHLTNNEAKGDLKRFKSFIESRGSETGAYRQDIPRQ